MLQNAKCSLRATTALYNVLSSPSSCSPSPCSWTLLSVPVFCAVLEPAASPPLSLEWRGPLPGHVFAAADDRTAPCRATEELDPEDSTLLFSRHPLTSSDRFPHTGIGVKLSFGLFDVDGPKMELKWWLFSPTCSHCLTAVFVTVEQHFIVTLSISLAWCGDMSKAFLGTLQGDIGHKVADVNGVRFWNGLGIIHSRFEPAFHTKTLVARDRLEENLHLQQEQKWERNNETEYTQTNFDKS